MVSWTSGDERSPAKAAYGKAHDAIGEGGAVPVTVFDLFHPVVAAAYFLGMLTIVMGVFQPPLLAIGAIAGACYSVYLKGWRSVARTLAWQLPLVAIISLLNPLFNSMGSTEMLRLGTHALYFESLAYGICMGVMLMAMLLWMSCAVQVITSDKLMALTGKAFPTIGLMLSMCGRLVPQFVSRGHDIDDTARACTAAGVQADGPAAKLRLSTVLMSWSMEDSLESSDAMRARGWGATDKRTTYARIRFRTRDAVALALIMALLAADVALVLALSPEFRFYPAITGLAPWWAYLPHVLAAFLPLLAEAWRYFAWKE